MRNLKQVSLVFLLALVLIAGGCASGSRKAALQAPAPETVAPTGATPAVETAPDAPEGPLEGPFQERAVEESFADLQIRERTVTPDEEAAARLEEALAAFQDAQFAWESEDPDQALQRLDDAYAVILEINVPTDSPFSQEKNGLRLLIAQRIQQIYASRLLPAGENHKTIPLVENEYVLREINLFQTRERQFFEESYKRSGQYREMMLAELRKGGLPEEISWLPLIESGFKVRALSRARALGLWQFISSTGYRFGLTRDKWIDERMDPVKSTRAAVQYLSELHGLFGDWTTALASYNCGEFRVQNVIRSQHINYLDNFWDLFRNLPRETARFVPRFIAVNLIVNNPEKYGFILPEPDPPLRYETITINRPVRLTDLSAALGLGPHDLTNMNPELRHNSTPDTDYQLKVPVGTGERVVATLASLSRYLPPEAVYSWHVVRRGETLGGIARRYRTTVAAITRMNSLKNPRLIHPGQRLKIPGAGSGAAAAAQPAAAPGSEITHVVRAGETLFQLARRYNTTVQRIKSDNGLRGDGINVGQRLVIRVGTT